MKIFAELSSLLTSESTHVFRTLKRGRSGAFYYEIPGKRVYLKNGQECQIRAYGFGSLATVRGRSGSMYLETKTRDYTANDIDSGKIEFLQNFGSREILIQTLLSYFRR